MVQLIHPQPLHVPGRSWVEWLVNRLRCMTPAEIPFRINRTLGAYAERFGLHASDDAIPSPVIEKDAPCWINRSANVDAARYLSAADRILAGRFDIFALRDVHLGAEPEWNRDPKTGCEAPLRFGKLLNYRDPKLVGDIKYLWELNRHMHLVTLAQAQAISGESAGLRYAAGIRRHLETWFYACPHRRGPNWASALEAAIRLINWSVCWQLLGGADCALFQGANGTAFRERWLLSIHQHVEFIRGNYSRFSSANNHLIGEAAGVLVAMSTWPYWPEANRRASEAAAILEKEVLEQNAPDGVNREQAVAYQLFELDLLLHALLAARARGGGFSPLWQMRVEAMIGYLASIMDPHGHVPMIGDSDDGYIVKLSQEEGFCPYRSVLATGGLLFRRADFQTKARIVDDKTRWLVGPKLQKAFGVEDGSRLPYQPKRAFRAGGYYLLGGQFETRDEIRLIMDAGPLGYNTICAHGHADALAFTLSVGGREVFIDPGTYTYLTNDPWRAYFRGTAAHNTLRIDGVDQSEPGGTFIWLRKARTHCTRWKVAPGYDLLEAWHDGYTRLPNPVLHKRRITLNKRTRRIIVEDRLETSGTHDVELFFHCSEHCYVDPQRRGYRIHNDGQSLQLRLPFAENSTHRVLHGSESPIGGWISRRFDEKQPCPTIVWRARIRGDTTLRSEISC